MKRVLVVGLLSLALYLPATGTVLAEMNEGEWEITVETEIPGMPTKMPPATYKQCLTQKDPVPESRQPGQPCKMQNVQRKGDTVTWRVICDTQEGATTGKGSVSYQGDTMTGSMKMTMQGITLQSKMKGRRLGACR